MRVPPSDSRLPPDPSCPPAAVWKVRGYVLLAVVGICVVVLTGNPVWMIPVVAVFFAAFSTVLRVQWNTHRHIAYDGIPRCIACGYDLTGLTPGIPCPECGNTRMFLDCRHCKFDLRGLPKHAPCPNCGRRESDGRERLSA